METGEIFVGRRHEMDLLRTALDAARAGSGRLVLLSGEPGIGKTRTTAELADHAARTGARVVWGRCHEEAGAPPYWLWAQIVRAAIPALGDDALRNDLGAGAADVGEIVPELRAHLPDLPPPPPTRYPAEARFRLFDSITRFLVAASRRRPLVIVLDDLHWADTPSLRLLEFLAPEVGDGHLMMIGTYRENELSRRHPLSDTLGGLTRVRHASRVRLSGLDDDEARRFIAFAAGIVPPAALTRSIHQQTEGNPLFLHEIVRFLREQGHFDPMREGQPGAAAIRLPEGVREVIGRRLNLLSANCNAVLGLASVIGREFAMDLLLHAHGAQSGGAQSGNDVLQALDEALDARIIEEMSGTRYQFTHALIRMTLYDELRAGQRRRLHRAVGEAIEALHRRDPEAVLPDLARHFQAAVVGGDVAKAVEYATRAGRRADALLAFEDASGFFQYALDLADQSPVPDPRQRCTLLLGLGEARRKANDYPGAKEALHEAAALARAKGFSDLLTDAALFFELAEWRGSEPNADISSSLLRQALAALPDTETVRRAILTARLARAWLYDHRIEEARALAHDALLMARESGDPGAIAASLGAMTDFPYGPEDCVWLRDAMIEMTAMSRRTDDLEAQSQALFRLALHSLELGRVQDCQEAIDAMVTVNARLRQPVYDHFDLGFRAGLATMRGELTVAEQHLREAARLRPPRRVAVQDSIATAVFALRREQGRLVELRPMVLAFAGRADTTVWRPGLALIHAELDDLDAARAVFDAVAADGFDAIPSDGRWNASLVYLAEVCAALDDAARAEPLYRLLRPWSGLNIVLGGGSGCAGAADRFLGLLAGTMGRWTDAETHFAGALAMNERIGALASLAHARHDFAAMLLARGFPGDRDRAFALLCQARDSAAALGLPAVARKVEARLAGLAAPVPVTPGPSAPDDLTARELEVLRLLAIGRGNADIALVLSISLNTVATHVRNILAKTGCANRTEAAAYAMRRGLHAAG